MPHRLLRNPLTWVLVAVLAVGGGLGLYWFQPWKLVTDTEVGEQLSNPVVVTPATTGPTTTGPATTAPATAGSAAPSSPSTSASTSAPAGPVLVSSGRFTSHEHATSGEARIIRLADGSHRLELVGLDTSNGPDLRVWLTDQPVIEGTAGWHVFDDGRWVELGRLKGNRGDQGYAIPADVNLTDFGSVSIWCKRFAVSFGAAQLRRPGG